MPTALSTRRGRRRIALATAVTCFAGLVAPLVGVGPASAATAPLVTTDGIGIRIDENAILGPALEAIEDELQPWVNDRIYQGAWENSVMDDPDWVQGSANLELSFDFVNAGTSGFPQGGLKVHADLEDIMMRFYRYGAWWQPECQFRVNPDDGWIDVSAKVDTTKLPNAPLTVNPVTAWWDDDPSITREVGNFACTGYLLDEWWDGLWGNGTDVAADLEAELDAVAQDMVDDLWADYVTPVVDSLEAFGITFGQIRTDDHGLIVTANVDASNGLTIPGDPNAPRNVANAQDSGVTSDVNVLLAQRASDVIVTVHPNVANQFLYALRLMLSGQFGSPSVSASIENILLDPAKHGDYADDGWTVSLAMATPTQAPYTQPTGAGGAPQVRMDDVFLIVRNTSKGTSPVAVFRGSATGVGLTTVVRPGGDVWGPAYDPSTMAVSLVVQTANADVLAHGPNPADMLPYAEASVAYFDEAIFQQYVSLAPIAIGGLSVDLCTTCGRYSGDQRYTETFTVS